MRICFYHCVTVSHLQTWSVFSQGGWDSGCLRCSWGLKPAEMVWTVSTFLSGNAANRWSNPSPHPPTLPLFIKPRASKYALLGGATGGTSDRRCSSFSKRVRRGLQESALSSKWCFVLRWTQLSVLHYTNLLLPVISSYLFCYLLVSSADRLGIFYFYFFAICLYRFSVI